MTISSQLDVACEALHSMNCKGIDELVCSGFDVNTKTEGDEWNLLHLALVSVARRPNPDIIRCLIELGVDVNARDRQQWTPLHFAVRSNSATTVKLLIEAGAEINAVNAEGITPLHQCLLRQPCDLGILDLLLSAGANSDIDSGRGTARRYAKVVSRPDKRAILDRLEAYPSA